MVQTGEVVQGEGKNQEVEEAEEADLMVETRDVVQESQEDRVEEAEIVAEVKEAGETETAEIDLNPWVPEELLTEI